MKKKLAVVFAALVLLIIGSPAYVELTIPAESAVSAESALPIDTAVRNDLQGRVVILDPGHGQGNSPAYAGYIEHIAMLKLAYEIKPLLEARGAVVHMTRMTEEDVSLSVRAAKVNKWALEAVRGARLRDLSEASEPDRAKLQSELNELDRLLEIIQSIIDDPRTNAPVYINSPFDSTYSRVIHPDWRKVFEYQSDPVVRDRFIFISLHSNATGNPINTSVDGAIVFHISNNIQRNATYYTNYSHTERNNYFAHLLLDNIAPLGIRKSGVREYHYFMTREHNVPGVLAENGFHTNDSDREKLSDDLFLAQLAQAYEKTVAEYFLTYVGPVSGLPYDPLAAASDWARGGIRSALEKGFVPDGLQDNYKDVITRAEFCLMAVKYIEYTAGKSIAEVMEERGVSIQPGIFADTDDPNILAAHALGVTSGTGSYTFTPDGLFSREQAATMIMNVCRALGRDIENAPRFGFDDIGSASEWAVNGINYCASNGIMNGTGNNMFSPKGLYTREQSILTFNNIPFGGPR